jgi:hypothetical protein
MNEQPITLKSCRRRTSYRKLTRLLRLWISLIAATAVTTVMTGCSSKAPKKQYIVQEVNLEDVDSSDAPKPFSCATIKKLYSIDLQDVNGYYAKLYVYVANKDSIYEINKCIQDSYAGKYKQVLSIWYLDKKQFAQQYVRAIDDRNISDAKFQQMDKHLIATYERFAGKEGNWDFNQ